MEENIVKKVLVCLKENGPVTFEQIFDAVYIGSMIEQNRLKNIFFNKQLVVELPSDNHKSESKYKISDAGKLFLNELTFHENLDLFRTFFYNDYHPHNETKYYHTLKYVCEYLKLSAYRTVEYNYDYEKTLYESGILERIHVDREYAYALKLEFYIDDWKLRSKVEDEHFYRKKYMDDFYKSDKFQNISTRVGVNNGNINIGNNAPVKQTIEHPEPIKPKKSFWDKYGDTAKFIAGLGAIATLIGYALKYFNIV